MDVQVLGPVEVHVDGRAIALGGGKPRALLAMLALDASSPVSTERLIEGLWGSEPPASAHKLVQVYVSQLRKALGRADDDVEIVTRRHGYELRAGADAIDVQRFTELIATGAPRQALALWHGPPLDDVADEPFAASEIRRLEELRLSALEQAIDYDLEEGLHREVVAELAALVTAEPLRERLHAQLMLALYRCGRQADALEAYRAARAALVEAIGAEPGAELRRLHEAILRQDPALDAPAVPALPPELEGASSLSGRDRERAWLRDRWREGGGYVVLTGPSGIGKTALAAALAGEVHRERAEVLFASGARPPDEVLATLARASTGSRPALLVLDDLDRASPGVVAAVAEFAAGTAAQRVLVLATAEAAPVTAPDELRLEPLDAAAVGAITEQYERQDEAAVGRLLLESGGVPRDVHRLAAAWARETAARRLDRSATRAAEGRAELRAAEDELAGDVVRVQSLRERSDEAAASLATVTCPFKGLASFEADDAGFFFGRERLVAEMVARLAGAPLVGIVGPSGSGKSSVLRAGLLPALAAGVLPGSEGWSIALLRPGERPLSALEVAVADAAAGSRLLIAVDQFEETFTTCASEPERAAFVDALVDAARGRARPAHVVIAIRADYYGRCAAYPQLWRLLGANQAPVGPMRDDELRRAIAMPARRAGLEVAPELVDALVADVQGEPGALPLLSSALLELWQQRDGRRLSLRAYEQSSGVEGAVARLAERAYEHLDRTQAQTARRILLRLAGEGDGDTVVRQRVPLDELEGGDVAQVLDVLADARLITIGEGHVEIAHEALLREWPRLRSWLTEDAQGRHLHHQLRTAAREWEAGDRDPAELYRGARLAAALDWWSTHEPDLNATERAFLTAGRDASERSQRRLRAVLTGVVALLVLSVAAGVLAIEQRGEARAGETAADAQRLGARALVENALDRSLLLARQGVALDDSVQTRGNLLAALVKSPAAIGMLRPTGQSVLSVALSPDDRTLVAGDDAGRVVFFDTLTRQRLDIVQSGGSRSADPDDAGVYGMAYSPTGRRLAIAHGPAAHAEVSLLDPRTRRVVGRAEIPDERAVVRLRYADDGRTLGIVMHRSGTQRTELVRVDGATGRRLGPPVDLGRGSLSASSRFANSLVSLTADGRKVVDPRGDETLVRRADSGRVVQRLGAGFPGATASAIAPDDRALVVGDAAGALQLLDLESGTLRGVSGPRGAAVELVAFSPDGGSLVAGDIEGDISFVDVARAEVVEELTGHAGSLRAFASSPESASLYSGSLDGTVYVWDLDGGRRLGRLFRAGSGHNVNNPRYALSGDGRLVAYGQDDGSISFTDARELLPRGEFQLNPGRERRVLGMTFVPHSRLLVAADEEGFLSLVDTRRNAKRALWRIRAHDGPIWTPGVSADGRLLVTGGRDGTVRLWSLPDGRPLDPPLTFDDFVADAQLSPDGRSIAVALSTRLEIWDVRSRRRLHTLNLLGGVHTARYSPDGGLLAVANDTGAQVLSTASWRPVTRTFAGHAGGILWAAISRDNRTLATSSSDGTVRLWDIASEQAMGAPLPGLAGHAVTGLLTPRGDAVIAGYDTGQAYRWDLRPAALARHACAIAGRTLTRVEWAEFLPGRDYDPACR